MSDKHEQGRASSTKQRHPDRAVWFVWAGIVLITLVALPFVVRQTAVVRAIADMCMTALSAGS